MQPTTEMQFGRSDSPSETLVSAFADGQVTLTVQNTEVAGHACDNELTLGQAIQLRDFLNRHIDGLALAATGSLTVRATDDLVPGVQTNAALAFRRTHAPHGQMLPRTTVTFY